MPLKTLTQLLAGEFKHHPPPTHHAKAEWLRIDLLIPDRPTTTTKKCCKTYTGKVDGTMCVILMQWHLSDSVQAAIAKCYRLGGLNNKSLLPIVLEAGSLRFYSEASSLVM